MKRFELHSHTMYSNIRLLDCINKPKDLINRAIELGLSGIAITDHDCLSGHIEINQYAQQIQEQYPNFKIALGNEIYLTENRDKNQQYYHFILIAKNKIGHRALRELSSKAWMNSYFDRGMERVPVLYSELEDIVKKYPNSLIATTACLGGELSSKTFELITCEQIGDTEGQQLAHQRIVDFVLWCKQLFKKDFYIECAPACNAKQIAVNKRLVSIAKCFDVKMIIGSDAHYLRKEDRYVHKAYLNSKGGEREVDEFYEYAYLQSEDEIRQHLNESIPNEIDAMFMNSMEIYDKIENYSLLHKQTIPQVEVKDYPELAVQGMSHYPILSSMFSSKDKIERYWINQCWEALEKKFEESPLKHPEYLERLEEEADIKRTIGQKLETNMFAYPVTLQHYVDLFWECGSTVGAGRGSSCSGLNHYLLGVTQLDPVKWDLKFWRYLNKEREEIGDIDIDLCPSKRPKIIKEIKKERGQNFNKNIDDLSRQNLGCTLIATFGTESSRSAVLSACRGYRSIEYPNGIDTDTAQYLSSLIPSERGFVWPIEDVVYGNPDKERKPVASFVKEVNQYPRLLEIMLGIQGLVNKRSSHASGVILFDEDPYEFGCFMKTPKGEIITQYDLGSCELAGLTKYDFLVTEVQDKIAETIRLLQEHGKISDNLSLREIYNRYFHPEVLPIGDNKYWKALQQGNILNVFQFDSEVGSQAIKKIQPNNIIELTDSNGLMRLMTSEKGAESPMDKYIRFKDNIHLWYQEMNNYGLTKEEQLVLEPYFLSSYGVPPSQEQLMQMLMDPSICNFSLSEANDSRKIVGKKLMSKIPELKEKVLSQAKSSNLGRYVWDCGISPQMGYAFARVHSLAYSFIGFQTIYLATNWNPIYWNTACLIVNSGSLEVEENEREKTTDYTKVAKALGDIINKGIKVSLIDINHSNYRFEPDEKNNQILFGMKALSGLNDSALNLIFQERPFESLDDFMVRCPLNKTQMVSLIKSGAFDSFEKEWGQNSKIEPRILAMVYYLYKTSELKQKITLQNLNGLIQKKMIPDYLDHQIKIYLLNKKFKTQSQNEQYHILEPDEEKLITEEYDSDKISIINGQVCIFQKDWEKIYRIEMNIVKDWLTDNQQGILDEYNQSLFLESWQKYANGSISAWEMDSLCFYYHEHELKNVNLFKYGISNFFNMPENPRVDYFIKRNNRQIPIYKLYRIIGTVIGKNDTRSSISLLTLEGVVNVKFNKEYYAMYNRQISEVRMDGSKKILEKGWFSRGTKILCTGYRKDDTFIAKRYSNTPTHQLYKITEVAKDGDLTLVHNRTSQGEMEDE